MKLCGHQKLKLFMTTMTIADEHQPPSNAQERLLETRPLSLQIAVCRFLFAGHLILDMDLNLKPNLELNLKQKSNKKLSGYQKLKVFISTMTIQQSNGNPLLMHKSNDLTLTISHYILQSLQFAGYSLLFAVSQLHESLQDEVCILPFLDISLQIVVAVCILQLLFADCSLQIEDCRLHFICHS